MGRPTQQQLQATTATPPALDPGHCLKTAANATTRSRSRSRKTPRRSVDSHTRFGVLLLRSIATCSSHTSHTLYSLRPLVPHICTVRPCFPQMAAIDVDPSSTAHSLAVAALRCLSHLTDKAKNVTTMHHRLVMASGALNVALFATAAYPVSTGLHRLALEVRLCLCSALSVVCSVFCVC